jgi:uncharacterized membrane protein YbhN (UPF0104 family)
MYRDFDFQRVAETLTGGLNWGWMTLSLGFGVTAQLFRGWRWRLSLDPLGEHPKRSRCVWAIFVSYAANLVVPRVGEISRCAILKRYDGVSVARSLGTVVTERVIDSLCILLLAALTLVAELPIIRTFFRQTGTRTDELTAWAEHLSTAEWLGSTEGLVVVACTVATVLLLGVLMRRLRLFAKVKDALGNLWQGVMSVWQMDRPWLYTAYTAGIWASYFLHFWLTFYCFGFTQHLGLGAASVMFVLGSMAVVVPTPNGAGPWHFVIITLLGLYGINKVDAGIFALLVHGIQTFLLILLGIYGLAALPLSRKGEKIIQESSNAPKDA